MRRIKVKQKASKPAENPTMRVYLTDGERSDLDLCTAFGSIILSETGQTEGIPWMIARATCLLTGLAMDQVEGHRIGLTIVAPCDASLSADDGACEHTAEDTDCARWRVRFAIVSSILVRPGGSGLVSLSGAPL